MAKKTRAKKAARPPAAKVAKPAAKVAEDDTKPQPQAVKEAAKEDEEKRRHVHRVDLGEAIPTPPIKTATDNE